MYPVLFSIGRFKLYTFGSFIALGTIVAGFFLYWLARRLKLPGHSLFDLVLYSLLGGLIGARLGYYLLYPEQFQSFWQLFYFWQGGLVALTGLITGFAVFLYYLRRDQLPHWPMMDISLLALLLGWAIGKFGCHLSACTVGRTTEFLALNGTYPVDLLSTVWAVLLLGGLFALWSQQKLRAGVIFFMGIEGLFLGEFLIRTTKADFSGSLAQLEAAAYLGLMVLVYALFWRLHGPKVSRSELGTTITNLVSRFRRRP
jgi:prolipoprotein diacylglyceryltransferase